MLYSAPRGEYHVTINAGDWRLEAIILFSYHGGMAWLDWVNTQGVHKDAAYDLVEDWPRLLAWLEGSGLYTPAEVAALQRLGQENPARAAQVLADCKRLRAGLRELAATHAGAGGWERTACDWLTGELGRLSARLQMVPGEHGVVSRLGPATLPGDVMLPVLASAAATVEGAQLDRLRKCENPACVQYFYDNSKSGTRRWCRMETCGNREKTRRHYQKTKGA